MKEFNIFKELNKPLAQQLGEINLEHNKYDYDRLFDADNRNPNARFLTIEDVEVIWLKI